MLFTTISPPCPSFNSIINHSYETYLYTYECERRKGSNSQELEMACGSPYSSSIIVATHTGQSVQVPGMPIVMPNPHQLRSDSFRTVFEEGEDDNSSPREPPAKKMALEANQVKVAFSSDNQLPYVHTTGENFIMTYEGTPIVAHPSMAAAPPQIIHMAPHHVIPTPKMPFCNHLYPVT